MVPPSSTGAEEKRRKADGPDASEVSARIDLVCEKGDSGCESVVDIVSVKDADLDVLTTHNNTQRGQAYEESASCMIPGEFLWGI